MKIICNTQQLAEAVSNTQKAVMTKTTMPILEGILLKTEENKHISVSAYPRTGLTTLRFSEYNDALQSEYVRKAVYYCLDRESISKEYLNGLGLPVNGVYGVGDWMLSMVSNEDDFPDFRKFPAITMKQPRSMVPAVSASSSISRYRFCPQPHSLSYRRV